MSEEPSPQEQRDYPADVHIVSHQSRTIYLIGTAHISQESVDLVEKVIREQKPDRVCIELDDKRYKALTDKKKWQALDLKEIIRKKQLSTLIINMLMASYQKKLGNKLGVSPGAELLKAATTANELGIPISLCDRDVRITLRRAWKSTSFFKKGYLFAALFTSLFDKTEVDEEKLSELKRTDVLSELMEEMGDVLPDVKRVLIDERDIYLAEKIKKSEGDVVVAIVGAGHVPGIIEKLKEDSSHMMTEISTIPPISKTFKILGWAIPLIIIASIIILGVQKGAAVAGANIIYWILANGIPSALGAAIALAHPITILSAFCGSPITSLTPVIGAGYVAAFVQVLVKPPVVLEFESVVDDITKFPKWWSNKLLRIFLVFFLAGFGSLIGTWVAGYEIISNLVS